MTRADGADEADEADVLAADRRRFRAHSATFIAGVFGWVVVGGLTGIGMLAYWAAPWLFIFASLSLVVSGVLAIRLGRTMFSRPIDPELGGLDPYASDGDAFVSEGLWTGNLWPSFSEAGAPVAVLVVGVVFLALSSWWAIASLG